ncbi:MAG TPA: sigma-70 family RNA polymerase sigma factor [Verrucomicrobiota bacterium]|nr:sigma-70 family RNA polymerase sigma factor [Verrucomicrobiota bacterium]
MSSGTLTSALPLAAAPAGPGSSVQSTTATLTRRLAAGDELAWREFHAAFALRLQRYLLVVCRGHEDAAAEAQQQTFLRAVKHVRICETEAELWSWLTLLARSAAADVRRREQRYLCFMERWFRHQPDPVFVPPEVDGHLEAALSAELASLPAAERELLEHKYLAGGSVRELATALGSTEKAVESRLTRARQKLKSALLKRLQNENRA